MGKVNILYPTTVFELLEHYFSGAETFQSKILTELSGIQFSTDQITRQINK